MLVAQGALIFGALAGLGVIKNQIKALEKIQLLPSCVGPVLDGPLRSAKSITRLIDAAEVVDELHLGRGWFR